MKKMIAIALLLMVGCTTSPKVEATKQWEGHYFDTNQLHKATSSIQLDKNESVWVLSNTTLKRLLKNVK